MREDKATRKREGKQRRNKRKGGGGRREKQREEKITYRAFRNSAECTYCGNGRIVYFTKLFLKAFIIMRCTTGPYGIIV